MEYHDGLLRFGEKFRTVAVCPHRCRYWGGWWDPACPCHDLRLFSTSKTVYSTFYLLGRHLFRGIDQVFNGWIPEPASRMANRIFCCGYPLYNFLVALLYGGGGAPGGRGRG